SSLRRPRPRSAPLGSWSRSSSKSPEHLLRSRHALLTRLPDHPGVAARWQALHELRLVLERGLFARMLQLLFAAMTRERIVAIARCSAGEPGSSRCHAASRTLHTPLRNLHASATSSAR